MLLLLSDCGCQYNIGVAAQVPCCQILLALVSPVAALLSFIFEKKSLA